VCWGVLGEWKGVGGGLRGGVWCGGLGRCALGVCGCWWWRECGVLNIFVSVRGLGELVGGGGWVVLWWGGWFFVLGGFSGRGWGWGGSE